MKDIKGTTIARLHRLQGQIRGIEKLVDQNQSLPVILQQLQAVEAAVRSLMVSLVEDRFDQVEDRVSMSVEEAGWIKRLLR